MIILLLAATIFGFFGAMALLVGGTLWLLEVLQKRKVTKEKKDGLL